MRMKRKKGNLTLGKVLLLHALFFFHTGFLVAQNDEITQDTPLVDEIEYEETDTAETNFFLENGEGEFKQDIKIRKLPDSALNAFLQNDAFWYANENWNKPKQKLQNTGSRGLLNLAWFRRLMWIIIICSFIAVVVWYLIAGNTGIFRRRPVAVAHSGEEEFSDNIFDISYTKEINKAIGSANFRLAVRLMFLQLLKTLSEKSHIQYKQDRTNLDYLMQLRQSAIYRDFFRLTRHYEYAWYGKFEVNNEMFASIKNDFDTFNRKLN